MNKKIVYENKKEASKTVCLSLLERYYSIFVKLQIFLNKPGLTREVLVNFFHFQNNVIRDTCFSQQHVELTGHATRHWMNPKPGKNKNWTFSQRLRKIPSLQAWRQGEGKNMSEVNK